MCIRKHAYNLSSQWRRWIKAGLSSSRASILVNGSPTSEFSLKRGLRQGDPLSHFIFIIVMEGLNIMLKDGIAANLFRGIKIGSPSLHLSYLFYADNVIIFSEWHQSDMYNIIRILDVFFLASGLKININKSNLYGVGVSSNEVIHMAEDCRVGNQIYYLQVVTLLLSKRSLEVKVNVVKSIHGDEAGIDLKGCQTNGLWAHIVGTIFQLHSSGIVPLNSISFKAGDGSLMWLTIDCFKGCSINGCIKVGV
ncbi:putative RNA-directed DNA polymerase, eukaryota, reverse transcriptase zinc-binding domain protein [Tanacetum coccineum]